MKRLFSYMKDYKLLTLLPLDNSKGENPHRSSPFESTLHANWLGLTANLKYQNHQYYLP